ncbi:DUF4148 domain-containing protein [Ideonella azotifigens]|uniref:DUF4148 domain-containing protein n=1 Tax=Ideonella azotifigens TaxID=513160 RepID=A0ABP3VC29_9BURK|nr:DUF4148 domain-containing protein [Ideonella azotifigens]MCD2344865.1 DUF4148 domain-containing protein [Ideonella azotifigens]
MQVTRFLGAAALGLAALTGVARAEDNTGTVNFDNQPTLSRAEVQADLVLWRRAGLDMLAAQEDSYVVFSADYKRRMANYQQWRHGPEYLAEVQRLGGHVTTAASGQGQSSQN